LSDLTQYKTENRDKTNEILAFTQGKGAQMKE